jgi:integrase
MLRGQGRAAAGASAVLRVLSAMAEDAIDDRCATVNPFKRVPLRAGDPRVSKPARATGIWPLAEMHRFAAAAGPRNEPMIRMLSDCGVRVGEMLALRRAFQDLKQASSAGRPAAGRGTGNDGGRLWRYDNWMRDVWNPTVRRTGMEATPKEFRAS